MRKYDLIIVGGCSAGLAAAVNAARLHPELNIAVLEKLPRVGKKLLATGNGRCNLTNYGAVSHPYHNLDFALTALEEYPPEKVVEFFGTMGLLTKADSEGRVYPRSNTASSVLDALRLEAEKLRINLICDTPVFQIEKKSNGFVINGEFSCEKLIISCGGLSSPSQGSDGSAFEAVKKLGHSFTPMLPSLVPLVSAPGETKALKGVRASGAKLTAECGKVIGTSCGEILFTDNGVSGIAAMELSAAFGEALRSNKNPAYLNIDLLPEMTQTQLTDYIKSLRIIKSGKSADELLTGILPKMTGIQMLKSAGIYGRKNISAFSDADCVKLSEQIKNYRIRITGTKDFRDSQVTRGGIRVSEIDGGTMKSLLCENLYFAGEIIDVDGGCGGFNLQWAWSSGLLAGEIR